MTGSFPVFHRARRTAVVNIFRFCLSPLLPFAASAFRRIHRGQSFSLFAVVNNSIF
jgi:hypothetical protein